MPESPLMHNTAFQKSAFYQHFTSILADRYGLNRGVDLPQIHMPMRWGLIRDIGSFCQAKELYNCSVLRRDFT